MCIRSQQDEALLPAGGLYAGEAGLEAAGEGEPVTGQQAGFPEVHPPPYWLPEVSGTQVPSAASLVQQYGSSPRSWQGMTPTLPAADAVART